VDTPTIGTAHACDGIITQCEADQKGDSRAENGTWSEVRTISQLFSEAIVRVRGRAELERPYGAF